MKSWAFASFDASITWQWSWFHNAHIIRCISKTCLNSYTVYCTIQRCFVQHFKTHFKSCWGSTVKQKMTYITSSSLNKADINLRSPVSVESYIRHNWKKSKSSILITIKALEICHHYNSVIFLADNRSAVSLYYKFSTLDGPTSSPLGRWPRAGHTVCSPSQT